MDGGLMLKTGTELRSYRGSSEVDPSLNKLGKVHDGVFHDMMSSIMGSLLCEAKLPHPLKLHQIPSTLGCFRDGAMGLPQDGWINMDAGKSLCTREITTLHGRCRNREVGRGEANVHSRCASTRKKTQERAAQ